MSEIGTLYGKLGLDVGDWSKGMTNAEKDVLGFAKKAMAAFGAIQIGKFIINAAKEVEEALTSIGRRTGATGRELAGLQDSFKKLGGSMEASFKDISDVMVLLHQRTGETGDSLENLTSLIIESAEMMGEQAVPNAKAMTEAVAKWNIAMADTPGFLEEIFRLSQDTGVQMGTLMEGIKTAGAALDGFGFSWEQAAALVAKFESTGVNADMALRSLRLALMQLAKAGIEPTEGFKQLIAGIQGAKTETDALQIATAVFGARGAVEMTAAIRSGRFEIDDMVKSMQNVGGGLLKTKEDSITFGESMAKMWNQLKLAVAPFGQVVLSLGSSALPALGMALVGVSQVMEPLSKLTLLVAVGLEKLLSIPKKLEEKTGFNIFKAWGEGLKWTLFLIPSIVGELTKTHEKVKEGTGLWGQMTESIVATVTEGKKLAELPPWLQVLLDKLTGNKEAATSLKDELSLVFKADLEARIKKITAALEKYGDELPITEQNRLKKEVVELQEQLGILVSPYMGDLIDKMWEMRGRTVMSTEAFGEIKGAAHAAAEAIGEGVEPVKEYGETTDKTLTAAQDDWNNFRSGVTSNLASLVEEWLKLPKAVDDWISEDIPVLGAAFKAIYKAFATMVAQMIAKWMTDLVFPMASSAIKAGGDIAKGISDAAGAAGKAVGGTVTGMATSMIDTISGIVTAVASVINLFKKPDYSAMTFWLKGIKDLNQEMRDYLFIVLEGQHLGFMHDIMVDDNKTQWDMVYKLGDIVGLLTEANGKLQGILDRTGHAQTGAVVTRPSLLAVGEQAPAIKEWVLPEPMLKGMIASGGSRQRPTVQAGDREIKLTIPIYIGADKIDERIVKTTEKRARLGRLQISSKAS